MQRHSLLMLFLWELLQNIPLIGGLVLALHLWETVTGGAVLAILLGAVLAAWVIHVTEGRIFRDFVPSTRQSVINAVSFAVLMFLSVLYLASAWSTYMSDLVCGTVVAGALTYLEDPERGRAPFSLRRAGALAISAVASLWLLRALRPWPWPAFALVSLWFTVVMSIYKVQRWQRKPESRPDESYG